jgi:uncharacterized membrane protein
MQPPQGPYSQGQYPQQQQGYPQQQQQYPQQQQQYPQQGYYGGYPQGYGIQPHGAAPSAPTGGLAAGGISFAAGAVVFLIAGFQGRRAGWEMLALPTMVAFVCGLMAGISGIIALTRKQTGTGLIALGLGGVGLLLALTGFALGS